MRYRWSTCTNVDRASLGSTCQCEAKPSTYGHPASPSPSPPAEPWADSPSSLRAAMNVSDAPINRPSLAELGCWPVGPSRRSSAFIITRAVIRSGLKSSRADSLQSHKRTAQTVWARCLSGLSRHLSRIPQLTPLKRRVLATAFPLSVLGQASASCQFPPLHLSCESCGQKQSKITLFCRPAATVSKPSQAHCTAWLSLPKFPCSISLFSCPRWKLPTNSSFLTPPSRS